MTVNENTQVNSPVLLFSAVDRDLNPNLAYSISKITAINSDKPEELLDTDATGIKVNTYNTISTVTSPVCLCLSTSTKSPFFHLSSSPRYMNPFLAVSRRPWASYPSRFSWQLLRLCLDYPCNSLVHLSNRSMTRLSYCHMTYPYLFWFSGDLHAAFHFTLPCMNYSLGIL